MSENTHENNVIELPLPENPTFGQLMEVLARKNMTNGIITYDCPCGCGEVMSVNFGEVSRKDAVWMSKIIEHQALYGDYGEDV